VSKHHPGYRAAVAADLSVKNERFAGTRYFWAETFCSAHSARALRLYGDKGNESAFKLMARTSKSDDPAWKRYQEKLEELIRSYKEPFTLARLQREVVSTMLYFTESRIS